MGPLVVTCDGCGVRIRVRRPEEARTRTCPRCQAPLGPALQARIASGRIATPVAPRIEPDAPAPAPPPRLRASVVWTAVALLAVLGVGVAAWRTRPTVLPVTPRVAARPIAGVRQTTPVSPSRRAERVAPAVPPRSPVEDSGAPAGQDLGPSVVETGPSTGMFDALRVDDVPEGVVDLVDRLPPRPEPPEGRDEGLPPAPAPGATADPGAPRRILVRDREGRELVSRLHGDRGDTIAVVLPDGRIAFASGRTFTDRPFRPASKAEVRTALQGGEFAHFAARETDHYVILYRCSEAFAEASGKLLESLYRGLRDEFSGHGLDVHEPEFPLVAVIFDTEAAFRAHGPVPEDVQAYFEGLSNRIYLYETATKAQNAPEVAAMHQPQTIAHEGTHQILQNLGVHPRLADWPLWLVEGLAEYCAPTWTRKGADWAGVGQVNALHMSTLRDLRDQAQLQPWLPGRAGPRIGRDPRTPMVEYLVARRELSPTDYALSWALTHYLASKRPEEFFAYLARLGRLEPMAPRTAEDQLAEFRDAFGPDLAKLDEAVGKHLGKLKYEELPYYAVLFEQPMPDNTVQFGSLVSQSPSYIRQWLETNRSPLGGPFQWRVIRGPTKVKASIAAEGWYRAHGGGRGPSPPRPGPPPRVGFPAAPRGLP